MRRISRVRVENATAFRVAPEEMSLVVFLLPFLSLILYRINMYFELLMFTSCGICGTTFSSQPAIQPGQSTTHAVVGKYSGSRASQRLSQAT
jgi:hypothetical protein